MLSIAPVLFFITSLVRCQAANVKEQASAVSELLKSKKPGKVDTKTLVASLAEVAKGLQLEDKNAFELALASKADCKKTAQALDLSLDKGKRALQIAQGDYQKVNSQIDALSASKSDLQSQIKATNTNLNNLQAKLKKMRKDKGLLKKQAQKSLRQIEVVISKTYQRENAVHHQGPTALEKKVSSLEELSRGLSFLQTDDGTDDENVENHQADKKEAAKHAPSLILRADKQAVVKASAETQRGFDEEEKKILDLVEVQRKKLADLDDNLADLQPAISNKLKQAMEINRTLDAAKRGMARDKDLNAIEKKKCKLIAEGMAAQKKNRGAVVNDVVMASKLIERMDTAMFLAKDIQGLQKPVPSFLQFGQSAEHEEASVEAPLSFVQEEELAGMGLQEMIENYGTATEMTGGPFDKVNKMIKGLISNLKAEANEEVNQHQFCQDSLGKNRNDKIAKKNSIDTLASTIRWSQMAIVRLDDDVQYMNKEMKRLTDLMGTETKELAAEKKRIKKELKEHKLANEVVAKAVVILTQVCNLKSAAASFIQASKSRGGSRMEQCKEAAKLLKDGLKGLKDLDTKTNAYLKGYTDLSTGINADAKKAKDARDSELKSTQAARAQRASELATAVKDKKEAEKELKLIDDAKKELEHQCSHVETREEKMARRKDEIDALKEALNVLEGEAIPV